MMAIKLKFLITHKTEHEIQEQALQDLVYFGTIRYLTIANFCTKLF